MRYNEYRYSWPPRPERAIPPNMLSHYGELGWLAQVKMNGTCSVLAVNPHRKIEAMNRHKETHKLWKPNADSERAFQDLPGKGWYVFVAELMHSKVADPGLKNINYVHDILVADGEHLTGMTCEDRLELLNKLFADQIGQQAQKAVSHLVIDANTWLARSYQHADFDKLFTEVIKRTEMEGLVLKDPKAKLKLCLKPSANSAWQVKCRRASKAYSH